MAALPSVAKGRPAAAGSSRRGDASPLAAGGVARFPYVGHRSSYQDTIHTIIYSFSTEYVMYSVFLEHGGRMDSEARAGRGSSVQPRGGVL